MGFDTLSIKDATDMVQVPEWLKNNRLYYRGDHWQDSRGWSGPLLDTDHSLYNQILLQIQRSFVSKNTIKEVTDRHMAGVIGREPMWSLVPRRSLAEGEEPAVDEQALIDEADAMLTAWWDGRDAHKTIQDATSTLVWSGRGALRLFVPPGERDETGVIPLADLETSAGRIYLHHPEPDQATVFLDRKTMRKLGIYVYEENEQALAELVYLDEAKDTVIRIARPDKEVEDPAFILPLAGHLTMYEMRRDALITEQVVQNQKLLNLALTMLQRNVVQAGFLERTFFNTQLPGQEVDDLYAPGGKRFVPDPLYIGPGATNFMSGVVTEDDQGRQVIATPSVIYRDPIPVVVFRDTKTEAYHNILEECRQLHAMITGDAAASGESRKQALVDFGQSVQDTKAQLEAAIRWLLETILALAAEFSGQPGRYDALRANVTCRLDLGPVSADDQRTAKELADAGIISKETAMSRVGIDDTDAEKALIDAEQEASSQRQQTTLATAVLNAQRQMASGAGSNGLEQPTTEEE